MKHLTEEQFFNKEFADAVRVLVKESTYTMQQAIELLKILEGFTPEDVDFFKDLRNTGYSFTTIRAVEMILKKRKKERHSFAKGGPIPDTCDTCGHSADAMACMLHYSAPKNIEELCEKYGGYPSLKDLEVEYSRRKKEARTRKAAPEMLRILKEFIDGESQGMTASNARVVIRKYNL